MATAARAKIVTLLYVGPSGHEDSTLGPLEPGERYQMTEELAAYRAQHDPDFWQRPPVKAAPAVEA